MSSQEPNEPIIDSSCPVTPPFCPRWKTLRTIVGILMMALVILILFQSCAAGVGNALLDNGEVSGSVGLICAILYLAAGVTGVVTRSARKKSGPITVCVICWLTCLFACAGAGSYTDLKLWGFVAFVFGCIYLFSTVEKGKKALIPVIVSVLALLLFVLLAAGGGKDSASDSKDEVKTPSAVSGDTVQAKTDETPAAEAIDAAPAEEETPQQDTPREEPVQTQTDEKITIAETVLLDEQNIKITALSFDADALFGPEVKLLIENGSDKNLTISAVGGSVNGYMADLSLYCNVSAGKKANDALSVMTSQLESCGIRQIGVMEFSFYIYDTDSWDTYLKSAAVTLKTSAADTVEDTYDSSGCAVYNENGIEIVVKGLSDGDSFLGPGVLLYMSNSSGRNIGISANDVSVNGFMVDSVFSCDITNGKRAVDTVTFFDYALEENGITQISDVALSFHIYDADSWKTIADTDTVALSFD